MKRIALVLGIALLSLVACGGKKSAPPGPGGQPPPPTAPAPGGW